MQLSFSVLATAAVALVSSTTEAWSTVPSYFSPCTNCGWSSSGASACSPGFIISLKALDSKFATYSRGTATSTLAELAVIGAHSAGVDTTAPPQWLVVDGGSAGMISLKNTATNKFLGRCVSSSCKKVAVDSAVAPVIVYESAVSANNIWQCVDLPVDTSIDPSGYSLALLGGNGQFLAHPNTTVVPASAGTTTQLGLRSTIANATIPPRDILFTANVIYDPYA